MPERRQTRSFLGHMGCVVPQKQKEGYLVKYIVTKVSDSFSAFSGIDNNFFLTSPRKVNLLFKLSSN